MSLDIESAMTSEVLDELFMLWKKILELQYEKPVEFDVTVRAFRRLFVE